MRGEVSRSSTLLLRTVERLSQALEGKPVG